MCLPSPKPKSNIFWFFLNLSFNLGNLPLNILITPSAGYEISFTRKFPDHYVYKKNDIQNLLLDANNRKLKLITTEKDYVKITENKNHIHFLPMELELSVKDKLNFELFLQERLSA